MRVIGGWVNVHSGSWVNVAHVTYFGVSGCEDGSFIISAYDEDGSAWLVACRYKSREAAIRALDGLIEAVGGSG